MTIATVGPSAEAAFTPLELGLRAVLPAFVASALLLAPALLAPRPSSERGEGRTIAWAAPLALGCAFFAAYVGIHGWPPRDAYPEMKARLAWLALGLAGAGALTAGLRRGALVVQGLVLLASGAWLVLHWWRIDAWTASRTTLWAAGFAGAAAALTLALRRTARSARGPLLPTSWALAAALASPAFYFAHSESHARMAVGLVVPLAGLAVLESLRPGSGSARAAAFVFVALFLALTLANHLTADLPLGALAALALAPLASVVGAVGGLAVRGRAWRWGVTLGAVALCAGLAIWLSHAANPALDGNDYLRSLGGG